LRRSGPGAPPAAAAAPAPPPEPVYQCSADGARFAVGQPLTPQLEAAARVRAGAGTVRVLKPNEAATTELNGGRLNLDVDARNRVTGRPLRLTGGFEGVRGQGCCPASATRAW
jgi:hypothetical protein